MIELFRWVLFDASDVEFWLFVAAFVAFVFLVNVALNRALRRKW